MFEVTSPKRQPQPSLNLDLTTFGSTPAAYYLSARLNELNNRKLARKISARMVSVRAMLNELINAHIDGHVSDKTLGSMAQALRDRVSVIEQNFTMDGEDVDQLSVNLMMNILIGELKNVSRRVAKVRHLKKNQCRMAAKLKQELGAAKVPDPKVIYQDGVRMIIQRSSLLMPIITVDCVTDHITANTLIQRSKAKLARQGKVSKLY